MGFLKNELVKLEIKRWPRYRVREWAIASLGALAQPYSRAPTVLVNEFDAGLLKRPSNFRSCFAPPPQKAILSF
jgi:hypothetical protein